VVRVLAYHLGSIGDTVITIPALRAIRRHFGLRAEIVILHDVHPGLATSPADVLAGGGEVDGFLSYPHCSGGSRVVSAVSLAWRIRHERFDSVGYLAPADRSVAQVSRDLLFFKMCGIAHRLGFHTFSEDILHPRDLEGKQIPSRHEAWFRLERLRRDGIDISIEEDLSQPFLAPPPRVLEKVRLWLRHRRRFPVRPLVAICPGSRRRSNAWPIERFVEIGYKLKRLETYELIVVGGTDDLSAGEHMVGKWGEALNCAGIFSVMESAALLAQCDFMIGLDTGTTHLGVAIGVPCVALYGCRNQLGRWEPLGRDCVVLRHPVPCLGCGLDVCALEGHDCMTGISADAVWKAVGQIRSLSPSRAYPGTDCS
jgi:heptosyltransferase III